MRLNPRFTLGAATVKPVRGSNRALLPLTREQNKRFVDRGITVVSLHPGIIAETRFGQGMPPLVRVAVETVARR